MKIENLSPAPGSKKKAKRIGRGMGSGHGKTATKGHKGQKARSGGNKGPAFEGGQTPLQRRVPKRGFTNSPFKKEYAIINLDDIAKLADIDTVTPEILIKLKIIRELKDGLKVLGDGNITRPVMIKAHAFSASAVSKIAAAGGKSEVL